MPSKEKIVTCTCPTCNHTHRIGKRVIAVHKGMAIGLWRVFKWCKKQGKHEFETKEVSQLWDKNMYARFGDWVMLGGLVYKNKKSHYGLNMERCDAFFRGKYAVPSYVTKDYVTHEIEQGPDVQFSDIPKLEKFLNEDGEYVAEYIAPKTNQTLF